MGAGSSRLDEIILTLKDWYVSLNPLLNLTPVIV